MKCSGIICFGDSNSYGFDPRSYLGDRYEKENRWCDIVSSKLGLRLINLSQNGRPVPAGKSRNLERIIRENPELNTLIIMLGTNDVLLGQSAEHICEKMEQFIEKIRALSDINIILLAPPRIEIPEDKELLKLSHLYEALALKLGCFFCDFHNLDAELCFDGVHLTEKDNRLFAEKFIKFIKKI